MEKNRKHIREKKTCTAIAKCTNIDKPFNQIVAPPKGPEGAVSFIKRIGEKGHLKKSGKQRLLTFNSIKDVSLVTRMSNILTCGDHSGMGNDLMSFSFF